MLFKFVFPVRCRAVVRIGFVRLFIGSWCHLGLLLFVAHLSKTDGAVFFLNSVASNAAKNVFSSGQVLVAIKKKVMSHTRTTCLCVMD